MTGKSTINSATAPPDRIQRMFNDIAPTYDLLNRIISLGLDRRWRATAIRLLEEKRGGAILDIAAGSGDLSFDAFRLEPGTIVATDFAVNMLSVLRQKAAKRHDPVELHTVACDALALPFPQERFDATMVAFGIRNFSDRLTALSEMHRVLKPGGLTLILELTEPTLAPVQWMHRLYSRGILPFIGRIISRHASAYAYLPHSIAHFPATEEFLGLMRSAGFISAAAHPLTFGTATIFIGRKKG